MIPWDESKHPRGGIENKGQFTETGGPDLPTRSAGFVSPSVKSGLDLKGAQRELASRQQARLRSASADINRRVGMPGVKEVNIIGAWKDGAENSIMSRSDADWDHTVLASVMKGHLADQKSVLVFQQQETGKAILAQFEATGTLAKIHRNLLDDGIENHTLVPKKGGATVYVVDLDGTSADKIDKAAQHYGEDNNVYIQFGRAEFIGNEDYSGSDREQRDRARSVYEKVIRESPVQDAQAIWEDVRNNWSATAPAKEQRWLSGSEDEAAYIAKIDVGEVEKKTKANVAAASAAALAAGTKPLPGSKATHPATIASRNPTAKGTKNAPAPPPAYGRPDVASMKADPEAFDHNVNLFRNEKFYTNFRAEDLTGTSDEAVRTVVDQMKSNLKFMYGFADHHTEVWYDGARAMVDDRAKLYGFNDASIAGVYAALSPMKDWDQNVHIADKLLETYKTKQDFRWSKEMDDVATGLWSSKNQKVVDAVRGKKLGELKTPEEKALWIRTYDETHNDQEYRNVLPDGSLGNIATNKDGTTSKVVWQSLPAIKNAVIALEANGDHEKISAAMGNAHKVRSFYNNILDPHSKNEDVTIDTHAVGAALLRNLTGSDAAVMHNFGNSPEKKDKPEGWEAASNSTKTGLSGTYAVYAQAYREAAHELGIQARQLQSAVWVVKREAFGALSEKQAAQIEDAWTAYRDGKGTLKSTQAEIARIAGLKKRMKDGWVHRDDEEGRRGGDARELHRSGMGWDAGGLDGGARGGASRGASRLESVRGEGWRTGLEILTDWDENLHPRVPAGQTGGGQFGTSGGGTVKAMPVVVTGKQNEEGKIEIPPERVARIEAEVNRTIAESGYDPSKVRIDHSSKYYNLGEEANVASGTCHLGTLDITIYPQNMFTPVFGGTLEQSVRGTVMHEIGHAKYQTVRNALREEALAAKADPNQPTPLLEKFSRHWGKARQERIKSDGITEYSKLYWDEYRKVPDSDKDKKGKALFIAEHETMAEFSRVSDMAGGKVLGGTPRWRSFYRDVMRAYDQLTGKKKK